MTTQEQSQIQPIVSPTFSISLGNGAVQPKWNLKAKFTDFSQRLDLAPVKFKLVKESSWDLERANLVEPQYKAFLFLIGTRRDHMFVPTQDIDTMWHTHILDTRKYMTDCAQYFGEYIHHYPYLGLEDDKDAERAHKLFTATRVAMFDDLNINVPGLELSDCGSGGGCGGGGGSSCSSGTSCGGGHVSCGGGHHVSCSSGHSGGHDSGHGHGHGGGHSHGDPASSILPIIASCTSPSTTSRTPYIRTPYQPSTPSRSPDRPRQQEKKRGIFRKILGLSPAESDEGASGWYASVTPEFFNQSEYRPDAKALNELSQYH